MGNGKRRVISSKKRIILMIVVLLAVIIAAAFVLKSRLFKKTVETNEYKTRVENIINEPYDPFSSEDEPYISDKDEKNNEYKISVNKRKNVITIYKKGKNNKFTEAFKSITCSVGRDVSTGKYKIGDRFYWKIVNGNVWAQYVTKIDKSVSFQSTPYTEKKKDTLLVKYYNQLGNNCNAKSIRMSVSDAKWIVENCSEGTNVEVFEDDKIGPLGKPEAIALSETEKWDPTDPDTNNPWKNTKITINGTSNRTVERGIAIDYLAGVSATNGSGSDLTSSLVVDSSVDIFKCGSYNVVYKVTDASGNSVEKKVVYKVVDTMPPVFSGIPAKTVITNPSAVSKSDFLSGIYVVDNNQFISSNAIEVLIPNLEAGENIVQYKIKDDYGNEATAQTMVIVDIEPPELTLTAGINNIIDFGQTVDEEYALSRVRAYDMGEQLSSEYISVDIVQNEWGYTFNYIATDLSGLKSEMSNTVLYPEITITTPSDQKVADLSNASLLAGVTITDSLGRNYTYENVKVTSSIKANNQYTINYELQYESPVGKRTAKATRIVEFTAAPQPTNDNKPTSTVSPSAKPVDNTKTHSEE